MRDNTWWSISMVKLIGWSHWLWFMAKGRSQYKMIPIFTSAREGQPSNYKQQLCFASTNFRASKINLFVNQQSMNVKQNRASSINPSRSGDRGMVWEDPGSSSVRHPRLRRFWWMFFCQNFTISSIKRMGILGYLGIVIVDDSGWVFWWKCFL